MKLSDAQKLMFHFGQNFGIIVSAKNTYSLVAPVHLRLLHDSLTICYLSVTFSLVLSLSFLLQLQMQINCIYHFITFASLAAQHFRQICIHKGLQCCLVHKKHNGRMYASLLLKDRTQKRERERENETVQDECMQTLEPKTWDAKIIISYYRDILWLFVFTLVRMFISYKELMNFICGASASAAAGCIDRVKCVHGIFGWTNTVNFGLCRL